MAETAVVNAFPLICVDIGWDGQNA